RRGLEKGDQLVSFAGKGAVTVNQYKNLLGQFPRGWRVPMKYRRESGGAPKEILVRLMGVTRREVVDPAKPPPKGGPVIMPAIPEAVKAVYKNKPGFANFYFNEQAQQRVLKDFAASAGDFTKLNGTWVIKLGGQVERNNITGAVTFLEKGSA